MKYFIVIVAVIAAVAASSQPSEEQITKLKAVSKECEESTHVKHDKIIEMRQKHFDDHDEHLKEYLFCNFKKVHWMDEEGHLQKENIKKFLTGQTENLEAMRSCKDKHGSTPPETAYLIYKCYLEHLPADYKYPL